jgi:hypothetical protein
MASVYDINRGVNKSLEFKGIKAQYILFLAAGLVVLLLLYAVLHLVGFGAYVCLGIIVPGGGLYIAAVQRMSKKYGEHGLKKKIAARQLPNAVLSLSRKVFINLKNPTHETK